VRELLFGRTLVLASVERWEARRRIEALLGRVVNGEGRYLPRVREVWIFGSYARGALEVGDVDLAVEFDQTKDEAGRWFATLMAGGFDHLGALRRELRGNQRALELHFNELDDLRKEGFEPQLLWRRGDSLEEAHARLAALAPDASARRAARDTVHPLLADVEKLIPRPARQEFALFVWAGWLEATLVELPPQRAASAVTRRRFAEQWAESNPRFRAAHAVASYLEREGVAPLSAGGTVYSDAREILDAERDYWQPRVAVHFGAKLLQWAMFDFGQGTPRVLVVLNPTARKQMLRALDMRATVDHEEFFHFQHGDGRLKLIERLAAAPPCRRAPRLHARVRRLAQNAGEASHFLNRPPVRTARSVPKTCPQGSARQTTRHRVSPFPATFGAAGRGHYAESLRLREVLHLLSSEADLQVFKPSPGLEPGTASLPWRFRASATRPVKSAC
jgi:hypothetical protein